MSDLKTPWSVGAHPWPEQIGCCPLVGKPYSVHGTDNLNVAAATTVEIARLIAAAPDLLAALKGLLADIEDYQRINNLGGENNHWQVIARAALARAEDSHV